MWLIGGGRGEDEEAWPGKLLTGGSCDSEDTYGFIYSLASPTNIKTFFF